MTTETVSGLNSAEQAIQQALTKVLAEFSPLALEAGKNLTWFSFLLDQVIEAAPGIHPMELARELYVRLTPGERKLISEAFQMGTLIANTVRNKSKEHNDAVKAEMQKAIQQRNEWEQNTYGHLAPRAGQ